MYLAPSINIKTFKNHQLYMSLQKFIDNFDVTKNLTYRNNSSFNGSNLQRDSRIYYYF